MVILASMLFLLAKMTILASILVGRVCYLPKFDFGKYVRWSCLLHTKIWQVYWLVVFVTCQNLFCLSVCLYGNFTKSQERLSQSSPILVTSTQQSMIPANLLDTDVGQITRSRGHKISQILKLS